MTLVKSVILVAAIFVVVALGIFIAAFLQYLSVQLALLLLIALLGLYLGFGVLIAVYRFTSKLNRQGGLKLPAEQLVITGTA